MIVTKGDAQKYNELVEKVMQRLDVEGYDINEDDNSPKFSKIEAIQSLKAPRTLKQLRSFMGTLNHLQKFIPDLHTHTVHFKGL